jgi:hypothetical protein
MADLIFTSATLVSFAVACACIAGCERLRGGKPNAAQQKEAESAGGELHG